LDALESGLDGRLDALPGEWGFAVYLPTSQHVYARNGTQPFLMASTAKLVLMLALLHERAAASQPLSDSDLELLQQMIDYSDNDAADAIWARLGGEAKLKAFLDTESRGGIGFEPGSFAWGDGSATAIGMALLVGRVYDAAFIDTAFRRLAIDLLSSVSSDQAWGASAAFRFSGAGGTVGVKNGWYPTESGWNVASVALALGESNEPAVVVAFTSGQADLGEAISMIEGIAVDAGIALAESRTDPSAGASPATTIRVFAPTPLGLPVLNGVCEESAEPPLRAGAYQCALGEGTIERCFAPAEGSPDMVVCRTGPGNRSRSVAVPVSGLTHPDPSPPGPDTQPSFVELFDGRVCERGDPAAGDRGISYQCPGDQFIHGPVVVGRRSLAYLFDPATGTGLEVPVLTLWY